MAEEPQRAIRVADERTENFDLESKFRTEQWEYRSKKMYLENEGAIIN